MEVIEVTEREVEVIEVIERGPQGPQGAGITTLTTQGDILYRGASTGERLPIGTTGQILKVSSGGIPEWGAAPSSGVSSVSGTSPIVSSGGSTPVISITAATTSAAGSMSAADKTKLDGIASGAEVNVNADWNASSGDAQILNKPTIPSTAADVGAVPTSRTISAGTGLTGGGDLSANRTLAVSYGTTAGTACQGNDGRISGIESGSTTISSATVEIANAGISIDTADGTGELHTGDGGSISTNDGGGSIDTSEGGGSINTRGTGSIEFGIAGTRTTLTGTATADRAISLPNAAGTLALTSDITKSAVGLGNVTNNAQTQAAIVPNTAPSAGQLLVGNAGGTAYAPATLSGDATIASTGALTLANTSTARTNIGLGNVANVDTTNAANISSGVLPNARVNWAAPDAIGSTTRNTGAFTTLNANNGTLTASAPVLDLSQTWNNAAVTFTGMRFNITNTASGGSSLLADFQVGGGSVFSISRSGRLRINAGGGLFVANGGESVFGSEESYGIRFVSGATGGWNAAYIVGGNTSVGYVAAQESFRLGLATNTADGDTRLYRDASHILAQRNGTNAQTFRLYNTFTDASNYERGFMRWSSNVFEIGAEAAGTGSNRNVRIGNINNIVFVGTTTGFGVGGGISVNAGSNQTSIVHSNCYLYLVSGRTELRGGANATDIVAVDNGLLKFSGLTSSFPALKRSSTTLQVRLADDSADAPFSSGAITTSGTVTANNTSSGFVTSSAPNGASPVRFAANTGDVLIQSANAAGIVEFRGTTGTNPQSLRVFNTFTSGTSFERLNIRWASNECIIDAEAGSGGGTLRGIKIGSATSSLLGFYGATPVSQRAAIADATDAATTQARLNDLLAAMRSLGLIAT